MPVKLDKCGSCGATIFWATTTNGTQMPIDVEPVPSGNLVCVAADSWRRIFVWPYNPQKHGPQVPRRQSHFASCPQARDWRKQQGTLPLEGA